jgi:hypothetical protein
MDLVVLLFGDVIAMLSAANDAPGGRAAGKHQHTRRQTALDRNTRHDPGLKSMVLTASYTAMNLAVRKGQ